MQNIFKSISVKDRFVIFLAGVLLFIAIRDHNVSLIFTALTAVVVATLLDSIFLSVKNKKIILSTSAMISGLIIGAVLSSSNPKWIFIVTPIFAIVSKIIIRLNHRHIFNPAAFGIFVAIILFSAQTQWIGTNLWYIFVPFGLYFSYKFRKLEILVGYAITTFILFSAIILMQHGNLLDIFNYLSYFFIFVMLIEPKTTPVTTWGKYLFGFGAAALIFIFNLFAFHFDIDLCALLILNLFVPLLNKISRRDSL